MQNATKPTIPAKPQITESDAALMQRESYVLQIKTNLCSNCSSGECYSELFELWVHPTKTGRAGLVQLRKPQTPHLISGLPIHPVKLAMKAVPLCSDCIDTFHVPQSEVLAPASEAEWKATLLRKYAPEEKKPSGRIEPALDQL